MIRTFDVRPAIRHGHAVRHAPRWFPPLRAGTWWRPIRELGLIAVFVAIYEGIRGHLVQAGGVAASHALLIVSAERHLGLFHEHAVQTAVLRDRTVIDVLNSYYGGTHFVVPVLVLVWLFLWHPAHYARARNALALTTGLAFVCFWLFPVAPPRLLPARFGILDTLRAGGSGHIESTLINAAGDQYASMPSVHVAWALWCTLAVYPVVRHWALRALAVAYPLLTSLVVVATGNHFFLDVIAGALLICVTWVGVTRAQVWLTVQFATWRTHRGQHVPVLAGGARTAAGPSRQLTSKRSRSMYPPDSVKPEGLLAPRADRPAAASNPFIPGPGLAAGGRRACRATAGRAGRRYGPGPDRDRPAPSGPGRREWPRRGGRVSRPPRARWRPRRAG